MANVILTTAISQARGRIGDIEFRQHNGITVAQARQKRRQPWSGPQHQHRDHFAGFARYAAHVRDDPTWRAVYAAAGAKRRKRPLNFWQMAVRDAANAPSIPEADPRDVRPKTGGCLRIQAEDDFGVVRVHVAVRDAAGAVLGCGEAERSVDKWMYHIPAPAPGAPCAASVVMTAFDRPGNFTVSACTLPR